MEMRIRSLSSFSEWKKAVASIIGFAVGSGLVWLVIGLFGGRLPGPDIVRFPLGFALLISPLILALVAYKKTFKDEPFKYDGRQPGIRLNESAGVIVIPIKEGERQFPIADSVIHVGSSSIQQLLPQMQGSSQTRKITVRTEMCRVVGSGNAFVFYHREGWSADVMPDVDTWPSIGNVQALPAKLVYRREFWPFVNALKRAVDQGNG